jgi:prepilin peptidase CpaA
MMVRGFIVPHSVPIALLLLAGAALLAYAALHDIGFRTVPNRVSAALLAIGLLLRLVHGLQQGNVGHELVWGIACGLIVFVFTYVFWFVGWMGGADVKLLSAAAVFVAPPMVPTLVVGTSLAGGVLALIYVIGSSIAPRPRPAADVSRFSLVHRAARCELRRLRRRGPLPYAAAIAAGGWLAIATS